MFLFSLCYLVLVLFLVQRWAIFGMLEEERRDPTKEGRGEEEEEEEASAEAKEEKV